MLPCREYLYQFITLNSAFDQIGSIGLIVNANQGLKTSVPKAAAMRPKICRSRPVMERIVEAV